MGVFEGEEVRCGEGDWVTGWVSCVIVGCSVSGWLFFLCCWPNFSCVMIPLDRSRLPLLILNTSYTEPVLAARLQVLNKAFAIRNE